MNVTDPTPAAPRRKTAGLFRKLSLSAASLILTFVALEVAVRRIKDVPLTYFANFVEARITLMRSVYPMQYDAALGWIPRRGDYSQSNFWGKTLTIGANGVRTNGNTAVDARAPVILAAGDSFTFGSQVADEETWPAVLERLTGDRVINGGVFAYGLDQSVLRAEQLAAIVKPDLIVVSFIPDNVNRAERAVRTGAAKPYFDIVDGRLALRNSPVPQYEAKKRIGFLRRVFGYSYLFDRAMKRVLGEERWYLGDWENVKVHDRGLEVARLLMGRLAAFSRRTATPVVVMAQQPEEIYERRLPETDAAIDGARANGIPVLDLYDPLRQIQHDDPARFRALYRGHMTAEGNRLVGEALFTFLEAEGLLPRVRHGRAWDSQ